MSILRSMPVPQEQADETQNDLIEKPVVIALPDKAGKRTVMGVLERFFSRADCYYHHEGKRAREEYEIRAAYARMLDQMRF